MSRKLAACRPYTIIRIRDILLEDFQLHQKPRDWVTAHYTMLQLTTKRNFDMLGHRVHHHEV